MSTRDRLAAALLAGGKTKQAVAGYKRVLADRAAVLGPDHLDTIATKASLASAYYTSGKMPSAVQLVRAGVRRFGAGPGRRPRRHAGPAGQLAHLYYAVGRVGDAQALLRDTLARCERVLPYGDPLTASRPPEPGEHRGRRLIRSRSRSYLAQTGADPEMHVRKQNVSKDADIGKALRAGSFACLSRCSARLPGSASMGVAVRPSGNAS